MSPLTLRRQYIKRSTTNNPAAHQAAATAAKRAQAQYPPAPLRHKEKTQVLQLQTGLLD